MRRRREEEWIVMTCTNPALFLTQPPFPPSTANLEHARVADKPIYFEEGFLLQRSDIRAACVLRTKSNRCSIFLSSSACACESLFHVTRMYSKGFVREIGRAREQIIDPCAILLSLFIQTEEGPITNIIVSSFCLRSSRPRTKRVHDANRRSSH